MFTLSSDLVRFVQEPDLVEDPCRVRANPNPGADLLVLGRLLVDVDLDTLVVAVVVQGERRDEPSDTAADDGYPERFSSINWHRVFCSCEARCIPGTSVGLIYLCDCSSPVLSCGATKRSFCEHLEDATDGQQNYMGHSFMCDK